MTQQMITLDPEVRDLLLEIAKDPRSRLFQQTPRELVTSATMDMPSVSANTSGWTPAEKHLLKAYKEEVASALGAVFHLLSTENAGSIDFIEAGKGYGPEVLQPATALASSTLLSDLDPGLQATVRTIAQGQGNTLPLDVITNVISRLRNDHRSGNLHGMALLLEGKHSEAGGILQRLLAESSRASVRYYAAINLGLARTLQCAPTEQYIGCYSAAVRAEPGREALASLVVCGAITGQTELSSLAACTFNDIVSSRDPHLFSLCRAFGNRDWDEQTISRLRDIRALADGSAGRLIDAILQ